MQTFVYATSAPGRRPEGVGFQQAINRGRENRPFQSELRLAWRRSVDSILKADPNEIGRHAAGADGRSNERVAPERLRLFNVRFGPPASPRLSRPRSFL